jgi:hypothetical protein
MMPHFAARRGAILPMVMLLVAVLTIALTAAYTLNANEVRVGDDQSEQLAALALAESGRHRFLIDRAALGHTATPPAPAETAKVNYSDGYAEVILTRIRPQVQQEPPLYVLRSRGVRTAGILKGNTPVAERTVAQYLYWDAAPINVLAGWTALTGIQKNGSSGQLSGFDSNPGTGDCPPGLGAVAGVAVPTIPGMTGTTTAAMGNPPIELLGDADATKGAVDIDWAALVNQTADITYDVIIPGDAWPSFADPNYWPTILVNGNLTLSTVGRGTLIVTGTLTMSGGGAVWDGVVLVGNTLISNGNGEVHGATITGLNILLGMAVPVQDIGNGNKTYEFNSCNAAKALKSQAKLRPFPNTWMDNWAAW